MPMNQSSVEVSNKVRVAAYVLAVAVCAATPSAQAQVGLSCVANTAGSIPVLRQEGTAELTGDIILTCTGGAATAGTAAPTTNITVTLWSPSGAPVQIVSGTGSNPYALLRINQPQTEVLAQAQNPGFGPNAPITICPPGGTCPTYEGLAPLPDTSFLNTILLNSLGSNATSAANVYQGVVITDEPDSLTFYDVPAAPPGATDAFTYTINDIFANDSSLPPGALVLAQPTSSNLTALPLFSNTLVVAQVQGAQACNLGSLQFQYGFYLFSSHRASSIIGVANFDGAGDVSITGTTNVDGVVNQVTTTGTYDVALGTAGCSALISAPGLPSPFKTFVAYMRQQSLEMGLATPGPYAAFGQGAPMPRVLACDGYLLDGYVGWHITGRTSAVGQANVDSASGTFTYAALASNGTQTNTITGQGTFAVNPNCMGTLHFNFPSTALGLPGDYNFVYTPRFKIGVEASSLNKFEGVEVLDTIGIEH